MPPAFTTQVYEPINSKLHLYSSFPFAALAWKRSKGTLAVTDS